MGQGALPEARRLQHHRQCGEVWWCGEGQRSPKPAPGSPILVEDEGPGIAAGRYASACSTPSFGWRNRAAARPAARALGLTIALAIVSSHDGSITLENRPEGGLCVTLSLPMLDKSLESQQHA
jgi:K+-sensing histidine kinase KdpD